MLSNISYSVVNTYKLLCLVLFLFFNDKYDQALQDELIIMSFHAMIGENHGVESDMTDHTLRSPLSTFSVFLYKMSAAKKRV